MKKVQIFLNFRKRNASFNEHFLQKHTYCVIGSSMGAMVPLSVLEAGLGAEFPAFPALPLACGGVIDFLGGALVAKV